MTVRIVLAAAIAVTVTHLHAAQQPPQSGAQGPPIQNAQAIAPLDLTGYWVSIVNEDWLWRMVTPPKGDYASVPLNAEGRRVADMWAPALDGRCEAYGAAGVMRMPTRLHITWQDDNTLKIETDAGAQTRLLHFGGRRPAGERSRQGYSLATWEFAGSQSGLGGFAFAPGFGPPPGPPRGGGPPPGGPEAARGGGLGRGGNAPRFGSLKVVTESLLAGWLRRNGVPYSEDAVVTEYYDRFKATNGDEWFAVTTVVNDPRYLQQEFVTSTHFKKEPDGAKWRPAPCRTS